MLWAMYMTNKTHHFLLLINMKDSTFGSESRPDLSLQIYENGRVKLKIQDDQRLALSQSYTPHETISALGLQ